MEVSSTEMRDGDVDVATYIITVHYISQHKGRLVISLKQTYKIKLGLLI